MTFNFLPDRTRVYVEVLHNGVLYCTEQTIELERLNDAYGLISSVLDETANAVKRRLRSDNV